MTTRILVIDDDAAIRLSLAILLQSKGYAVSEASDGAAGLAQFLAVAPDVVMSDMIMPGHEGIQTIGKIRALAPDLPIIAMSGSIKGGPTSFLDRARDAGANHILEKPFEAGQLMALLAQIAAAQAV